MRTLIIQLLWLVGFLLSITGFIVSAINYRNNKTHKNAMIITGIACFILGLPVALLAVLFVGMAVGLVGM
jgi:Na+-driven multidrug efflux pump